MWFKLKLFLTFLLKSTNQHGVHSPFVFNLVTNCFYKKTEAADKEYFKKIRKTLLKNNNTIEVQDFGNGSKVFKTNVRKVAEITKIAGISTKKAFLLIRLIQYFKPSQLLEIGTSVGLATSAMSLANKKGMITTLEGCQQTANVASTLFKKFEFSNISQVIGKFEDTLSELSKKNHFDFIYFDGNHSIKATLNYFEICLKTATNNSVFIFDDINYSDEMQNAWKTIIENPKVTVSIDTFFWGIVFFRTEQVKQHFTIRV